MQITSSFTMRRLMRPWWLVMALAAGGAFGSVWSCSSTKEAPTPDAGAGGGAAMAGAAGSSASGGAGGAAGSAGASGPGSAGASGVAGKTGAGGGGAAGGNGAGGATAVRATCMGLAVDNRTPGAVANPEDFSPNLETGARDQHTLWMGRADMVRRVLSYETAGAADHTHVVAFTDAELNTLLGGGSVTVMTMGPPSNAATGHDHVVVVSSCGVTQGFGGAAGPSR